MSATEILAPQHNQAILQWYLDNGVDEILESAPVDRLAEKPQMVASVSKIDHASQKEVSQPSSISVVGTPELKTEADNISAAATTLEELKTAILKFEGLSLKKTAMNMVFASGNPTAKIMVIGDAPEADDDRSGQAFSGEVGDLTDKMFAAIGLNRDGIYLTNVLNWRPPGNRSPLAAEIELSLPFIHRHIQLVKPQFIFLMGGVASKSLLGVDDTIGKLRGKIHTVISGDFSCPALVTYHPSFLLRSPLKKREAWDDLLLLKQHVLQSS